MVKKTIDIRPHTRYNIDNLIRKQCYHYRIFSENGSHKYEFAGKSVKSSCCLTYVDQEKHRFSVVT